MLKMFKLKQKYVSDGAVVHSNIFRKTKDEAIKSEESESLELISIEEVEPPFKCNIRFSKDEIVYHVRMLKFSEFIKTAHPTMRSLEFSSKGIHGMSKHGPYTIYSCTTSKETLSFIDGYWETLFLLDHISKNTGE